MANSFSWVKKDLPVGLFGKSCRNVNSAVNFLGTRDSIGSCSRLNLQVPLSRNSHQNYLNCHPQIYGIPEIPEILRTVRLDQDLFGPVTSFPITISRFFYPIRLMIVTKLKILQLTQDPYFSRTSLKVLASKMYDKIGLKKDLQVGFFGKPWRNVNSIVNCPGARDSIRSCSRLASPSFPEFASELFELLGNSKNF